MTDEEIKKILILAGVKMHTHEEMKKIENEMVQPLLKFFESEKDMAKLFLLLEMVKTSLESFFLPELLRLFKEANPDIQDKSARNFRMEVH